VTVAARMVVARPAALTLWSIMLAVGETRLPTPRRDRSCAAPPTGTATH